MNICPGGKQAHLHNSWFICDGEKVIQPMVYSPDNNQNPNMPKGIKAVFSEHGLWQADLWGKCEKRCKSNDCCNKRILRLQPDFLEQKSLVQETIEAAKHLCLFLPKFHCKLNPIGYFWGMVKKYLCDHCNYSFDGLKDNLPKALESVQIQTIWQWENKFFCWVEAYCSGLGLVEAHAHVKKYTSRQFTSHRCVSERVAATFDWFMCTVAPSVQGWPNQFMLKILLPQFWSNQLSLLQILSTPKSMSFCKRNKKSDEILKWQNCCTI